MENSGIIATLRENHPPEIARPRSLRNNRIEVLTVLSQTILRELDAFRHEENLTGVEDNAKFDLYKEVEKFETDLIRCALIKSGGRQRQAARMLNVKVTTLHAKIRRLGIVPMGSFTPED